MKLRYFIPSIVAVVAAMFTSCSDDNNPTYLDEVRVSSSYVALPQDGGTNSISITTADSWSIAEESIPSWLTVSPTSGGVGVGSITFKADATTDGRECELLINCGGKVQRINVLQSAEETDPVIMTVSEAVALIKANAYTDKAVYVKGIVCRIQEISVQYGNATYFISDDGSFGDGNWLEIYRGFWYNAEKFTSGDEFSVGDELVVKGVLTDYKGTPETAEKTAEVISMSKSLLKCDSLTIGDETTNVLPVEGGEIVANLTCKGTGVAVEIPAEAQSWLGVVYSTVGENPTITFRVAPNTGGDRKATVTFKTTDGTKEYTSQAEIVQKGAIIECPISDFLAAAVGDTQYRLTGVISKVANAQYGNVYLKDYSGETYVYGIGAKGDFEKLGLKEGDVVTLVGKRGEHNGTIQMAGAVYEKSIVVTEVSLTDFLAKAPAADVYYRISGTIESIANDTYGNLYLTDGVEKVYVYGCYPGWGATGDARKGLVGALGLAAGDKLSVIGVRAEHNGTAQLGNGIYFSHEKAQ